MAVNDIDMGPAGALVVDEAPREGLIVGGVLVCSAERVRLRRKNTIAPNDTVLLTDDLRALVEGDADWDALLPVDLQPELFADRRDLRAAVVDLAS